MSGSGGGGDIRGGGGDISGGGGDIRNGVGDCSPRQILRNCVGDLTLS